MARRPIGLTAIGLFALLCFAVAGSSIVHAQGSPQPVESPETQEADSATSPIDVILADLEHSRAEASFVAADVSSATGDDLAALTTTAVALRLQMLGLVGDLVTAVQELEQENPEAAAPYRARVVTMLPEVSEGLRVAYDVMTSSIASIKTELAAAASDAAASLESKIRLREETLDEIFAAGIEQIERLEAFDLDAGPLRAWLSEGVAARGRLLSSRMHLASIRLADAERLLAARPTDAASIEERDTAMLRLELNGQALERVVPMVQALGMDASRYKAILLEATGEITADVLDTSVIGTLAQRWIEGVRESVATNGPSVALRTLLFFLVLSIFYGFSRIVRSVTERAVAAPHLRFSTLLKRMIVSVASGLILIIGLLVGLSQLGFQVGPMVAGLGIAGFIVGFALQETLGNFAAGIMILTYRPYDVGDLIECAGAAVFGKVSHMNLVSTTILTLDNRTRVVPNGKIWGDVITNVTAQKYRRVDLVFGISYSDDIPLAEKVLESIVLEHPKVLDDPEPVVKLHELGDSSVNFVCRPWCRPDDYWDVHWDITREVKMRFDRDGISIPFPQRDVHFYPSGAEVAERAATNGTPQRGETEKSGQDAPDPSGSPEDDGDGV